MTIWTLFCFTNKVVDPHTFIDVGLKQREGVSLQFHVWSELLQQSPSDILDFVSTAYTEALGGNISCNLVLPVKSHHTVVLQVLMRPQNIMI